MAERPISPALNKVSQFYLPHIEGVAMQLYYAQKNSYDPHWPAITAGQRLAFREVAAGLMRELYSQSQQMEKYDV